MVIERETFPYKSLLRVKFRATENSQGRTFWHERHVEPLHFFVDNTAAIGWHHCRDKNDRRMTSVEHRKIIHDIQISKRNKRFRECKVIRFFAKRPAQIF